MKSFLGVVSSIFMLFFSAKGTFGQVDSIPKKIYKHGLGAAAGFTTGYGVSYRYWPQKFGGQITVFKIWNNYGGENIQANLGITFLLKLRESGHVRLFLYEGNMYYYEKEQVYAMGGGLHWVNEDHVFNFGIGPGVQFTIDKRLGFNLMVGAGAYYAFTDWARIFITGETGLYYRF